MKSTSATTSESLEILAGEPGCGSRWSHGEPSEFPTEPAPWIAQRFREKHWLRRSAPKRPTARVVAERKAVVADELSGQLGRRRSNSWPWLASRISQNHASDPAPTQSLARRGPAEDACAASRSTSPTRVARYFCGAPWKFIDRAKTVCRERPAPPAPISSRNRCDKLRTCSSIIMHISMSAVRFRPTRK